MSITTGGSLKSQRGHEEMNSLERCLATIRHQPHDRGGDYILGPGCALPATTPHANIDKLIECAGAWGAYTCIVEFRLLQRHAIRLQILNYRSSQKGGVS